VKVLVAIDHSETSRKAVAMAGKMLGRQPEGLSVTLFHVVESLPEFILARSGTGEAGTAFRQVADEWARANRDLGQKLLTEQSQSLASAGIPAASINVKLCERPGRPESRRVVAALAIIEEMKAGNYELVVVGRRATSSNIETLLGGVAEKVAREAHGRTIWIVD
jgi:nucleotide-binding universal stress UspA family protein